MANKDIHFLICKKCLWVASLYSNMSNFSSPDIKCPICNDNRNLESLPISESELLNIINNTTVM
jgi:hypothetical protein